MRGLALAAVVIAVLASAARWGSFVAGGSDSYCYVHQAERWAAALTGTGPLQVPEALALEAPWPDAPLTFAPVGHLPSPTVAGASVPICPPGLPLAMAPFVMAGGTRAAFAVVPLFGVLLALAVYAVGARFGARIGLASAVLAAASPVFLYQLVQPMSDVPAAALWTLAVALATGTKPRHTAWSGAATSAAILVRPNLVPLGVVIGLFLLLRPERSWPQRFRAGVTYSAASAVGCVAVAIVQNAFYGSPLASGYGSFDALFSAANAGPNLRNYLQWLLETHTAAIALALLAPLLLPGALTALLASMFLVNLALYLPYTVFEHWSFLRFMLPTVPLVLVLAVASIDAMWRRWTPVRDARPAVAAATALLAVLFVREANDRSAFRLHTQEARFERAGMFVRDRLPRNALLITGWHSGSARLYGHRKTMLWDSLDPQWLERAIVYLRERGFEPYLMFERWEEPAFRQRFASSPTGALDWPPAAEIGAQVRIYRPGDRERYQQGTVPPTEYVR